ncbi:MAG: aconitate hydratase AcnA, partial [Acidobacteriota bacterium]
EKQGVGTVFHLPFSLRVLLDSVLRGMASGQAREEHLLALLRRPGREESPAEVPFRPARVLMQDFTGVPGIVDLAALRSALARLGGDPARINPSIPVDLVIDHSVQVDRFASVSAARFNAQREFERNQERYAFLRWGARAFRNLRVVPPDTGIVHQVNLEYLACVVQVREEQGVLTAFPDSLVGTDSHTTMINGLGVVGWGVGGIEAEAVMLGQSLDMLVPEVVGMELIGSPPPGTTATDLVLAIVEILRGHGVVGKFVEFHGPGLAHLGLADRATIANMAPEYGATMGFFPVDQETLSYLTETGRPLQLVQTVERYCKEQGLFLAGEAGDLEFGERLSLDLATVEPCIAGPTRPQDRIPLCKARAVFREDLAGAFAVAADQREKVVAIDGMNSKLGHGSVVIAAITSCTNTSNPTVMIGAGLLARKAAARGLKMPDHVKTSLAPGSRVVTRYLEACGLLPDLQKLGFHLVGYGCTTCIGNSGSLPEPVARVIEENDLVAAAVLSGNRNFEGRINPHVKANYLASPPLVIAYALAGTVDIDLEKDPLGTDESGKAVFLREIWPEPREIQEFQHRSLRPELFQREYAKAFSGGEAWSQIPVSDEALYPWNEDSTYIQEPPFFRDLTVEIPPQPPLMGLRVLVLLGDSVTTDHISPAGAIPVDGPAGQYLLEKGIGPEEFNSFGSRRGNHQVMMRGTFGNIRIRNRLVPGREGGVTRHLPDGEVLSIFDVAMRYRQAGVPLMVMAGQEYGTGSSRDWAAKGPLLLGVRVVLARSYERIHRSNLVGMGILPLQFLPGDSVESLGLTGKELFHVAGDGEALRPGLEVKMEARSENGKVTSFTALVRLDSTAELTSYENGGILQTVLRDLLGH